MTPAIALLGGVVGYLLGSLPVGLLVGRAAGVGDIRAHGSGKTGFTNALRTLGLRWALLVVAGDLAKGALPVLVGRFLFDEPWAAALGGLGAVVGHTWPLFAGFRGGRGVATAFGAFVAVSPIAAIAVGVVAAVVLAIWRYASLMSVIGVALGLVVLVALVLVDALAPEYLLFGVLTALAVEFNHIGNIRRLLAGTEPKLGQGGAPRPPASA
ncbi:MAG: glycerol-3-phosphate 1-O-acyltransferase PlsY [Dehalococcoidia bacterium]